MRYEKRDRGIAVKTLLYLYVLLRKHLRGKEYRCRYKPVIPTKAMSIQCRYSKCFPFVTLCIVYVLSDALQFRHYISYLETSFDTVDYIYMACSLGVVILRLYFFTKWYLFDHVKYLDSIFLVSIKLSLAINEVANWICIISPVDIPPNAIPLMILIGICWFYSVIHDVCLFIHYRRARTPIHPVLLHHEIVPLDMILTHKCMETTNCDVCPCMICYGIVDTTMKMTCNHVIHLKCIQEWFATLRAKNLPLTCPICRTECVL